MRISGRGGSSPTGARREAGRADAAGEGFALARPATSGAHAVGGGAPVLPLASLGALVALQTLPDALDRRRRAVRRGGKLLDDLEEIRLALLEGSLPVATLVQLQAELASVREAGGEPRLEEIVREIEVRAAVELAKLEPDFADTA